MKSDSANEKGHLKITLSTHETLIIGDVEIRISNKGKRKARSQTGLFVTAPKRMTIARVKDEEMEETNVIDQKTISPPAKENSLQFAMSALIESRHSDIWFDFEARFISDMKDRCLTFEQCSTAQQTFLARLFRKLEVSKNFGLIKTV